MRRVAKPEHQPVAEIPAILRVDVAVAVEPELRVVPLEVEHVQVAVGIEIVRKTVFATAS